jgi:hypothetical protein
MEQRVQHKVLVQMHNNFQSIPWGSLCLIADEHQQCYSVPPCTILLLKCPLNFQVVPYAMAAAVLESGRSDMD